MEVTLEELSKWFGQVKAVSNLSLKIEDGEFVALLGPSGCGKTTTLLMIAGIYKPTSGRIYFGDRVVNDLPPKDRKIGMVFQDYALYPHMTVLQNIAFPLKLQRVPRKVREERAREAAELVQIEELLDRRPSQLSGGQQQRVALARALVKEPDILLLDEPLSNLDAKLRITMRAELKRLQKELGITTIFVTHDQLEALTMADRIAVLDRGELQQFSTPDELYNSPSNLFVAGFIGTPPMNFIEASLERLAGEVFLVNEVLRLRLPEELARRVATSMPASAQLVLGIRPEDVAIAQEGELEGEIQVLEPLGRDLLVTISLGSGGTQGPTIKVLAPPTLRAAMGDKVKLQLDMGRIHLFDKATGEAL